MTCWWHHWHGVGRLHLVTLRPSGRCTRPQEIVAQREQCCRCEALRWREDDPGTQLWRRTIRDAQVLEVGAECTWFGFEVTR